MTRYVAARPSSQRDSGVTLMTCIARCVSCNGLPQSALRSG